MSCHQCPHMRIIVELGPCCAGVEVVAFAEQVMQLGQLAAAAADAVGQPQMKCWVSKCQTSWLLYFLCLL